MTNYKINELLGDIPFQKQNHKNPLKFFDGKKIFAIMWVLLIFLT